MLLQFPIEREDCSILEKMKNITIKDIIYWLAEELDNLKKHLIQTSWKKVWPSFVFEETPSIPASNNKYILQLLQEIPRCEDAGENCLQEWISVDDNSHQDISDEAIVSMVQST